MMIGKKIDHVIKDLMVRNEKLKINGLILCPLSKSVRKIKYVWAFNKVHRSMDVDHVRADARSIINPHCEVAC